MEFLFGLVVGVILTVIVIASIAYLKNRQASDIYPAAAEVPMETVGDTGEMAEEEAYDESIYDVPEYDEVPSAPTPLPSPEPIESVRVVGEAEAVYDESIYDIPEYDEAVEAADEGAVDEEKPYHEEIIFYATDRKSTGGTEPTEFFGGKRNRAGLSYGTCLVSIPKRHQAGVLEAPSIWKLEFKENPEKHIVLLKVTVQDKDSYFTDLAIRTASTDSNLFLFIHGYNVTFENAARRTAQMSYDFRVLGFNAAPVLYSWPSRGVTGRYTADEATVDWSDINLKVFLIDLVERSGADKIYIIAHSMGNRALTKAFITLVSERPELKDRFEAIILAAPDIDADIFMDEIVPKITPQTANHPSVTLYASRDDKALALSKKVHDNPRAGDAGENLIVVDGVETIDTSGLDTSFLAHSYFVEVGPVMTDILEIMKTQGKGADHRTIPQPVSDDVRGKHWVIR